MASEKQIDSSEQNTPRFSFPLKDVVTIAAGLAVIFAAIVFTGGLIYWDAFSRFLHIPPFDVSFASWRYNTFGAVVATGWILIVLFTAFSVVYERNGNIGKQGTVTRFSTTHNLLSLALEILFVVAILFGMTNGPETLELVYLAPLSRPRIADSNVIDISKKRRSSGCGKVVNP